MIELLVVIAIIASWLDFPGSHHNGACGFSFADGRSEIKKWRGAAIGNLPAGFIERRYAITPTTPADRADLEWVKERKSSK